MPRYEHLGTLASTTATAAKTSLWKALSRLCQSAENVKCRPISLEFISREPQSNFRKRKKNSSSLGYVLHKAWNQAFSQKCSDGKEMYKKAWCTRKVVLRNKPFAFLSFSLPSPLLKLPNCSGLLLEQLLRLFRALQTSDVLHTIVSRGDWLGKPANIKVENNGAVVYVGSSLTVHNPLFFVHKLWLNKLMQCFYWSVSSKW